MNRWKKEERAGKRNRQQLQEEGSECRKRKREREIE